MTGLLSWSDDEDSNFSHHDGAIVAWFGDRTYHIWPEGLSTTELGGYRIMSGSFESGHEPLGSLDIGGEPGERTLEAAKAIAEAEAISLLDQEQLALVATAKKWIDEQGIPCVRVDGKQLFYRVDNAADVEIELIASPDFDDWFDSSERTWYVGQDSLVNNPESLESLLHNLIAEHAADLGGTG